MKHHKPILFSAILLPLLLSPSATWASTVKCPCELMGILVEETPCTGCLFPTFQPGEEAPGMDRPDTREVETDTGDEALEILRRGVSLLRFVICMVEELMIDLVKETIPGGERR